MEVKEIKKIIKQELPQMMQTDEEVTRFILRLSSQYYAGKIETENRFDRILGEIQKDREEQTRKWEQQNQKWEEQNQKWKENQKVIYGLFEELKVMNRKYDQSIGALGARWGMRSEASFRNALAGILKESFQVQVLHITEFDDKGEVFGQADQVELDILIKNGLLIICEIKSSLSKPDVYVFDKKIRFYEKLHESKADRRIIISPMIDDKARDLAIKIGMEVYSYADEINK